MPSSTSGAVHVALLASAMVLGPACATLPAQGQDLSSGSALLQEQVWFDHQCPPERVRVLRRDRGGTNTDLDVCGQVRRYKLFHFPSGTSTADSFAWLDVTSLFPASALPSPGAP